MKPEKRYFIILAWFAIVASGGMLLFTKGFLLKRLVVDEISSCQVNFTTKTDPNEQEAEGCWMHKRFKRAVIIVVDALRYDFAAYHPSIKTGTERPYQNKFKIIRELLRKKPNQSRLYKFVADPPTTTLQRLKGLTTGSLPTFVDAGANFASSEIIEDNIIDHLVRSNRSITFMGDDTWTGLFPNRFKKVFSFPSLNVKDLHTVDDGIIKHLVPELKLKDWDVLIAHFLGVDHCGHRYGPNHPAMADKLTQMDKIIRSVVKQLKQDTVLFVMGDHGMTRTGDHGGDSLDELEAALFVYSPARITTMPPQKGNHKSVFQVDLVPTLSLLLGLPIPFSNLGSIVTDLFTYCPWWKSDSNKVQQKYHAVKALRLNAHQIHEYLMTYSLKSDEFPYIELAELDFLFRRCETQLQEMLTLLQIEGDDEHLEDNLDGLHDEYVTFLMDSRNMCQRIWAKFDHPNMLLGGISTVMSIVAMAYIVVVVDPEWDTCCAKVYAAVVGSGWVVVFFAFLYLVGLGTTGLIASISLGLPAIGISTYIVSRVLQSSFKETGVDEQVPIQTGDKENEYQQYDYTSFLSSNFASLCMIVYAATMFSNSFVVFEDAVVSFLIPTISCVIFYQISRDLTKTHYLDDSKSASVGGKKYKFDIMRLITSPRGLVLLLVLLLNLCIRLTSIFRACREEQWTCELSQFLQPLSSLTNDVAGYKNIRYFLSVIAMVAVPAAVHKWLRYHGNLNGFAPAVLITLYAIPVCSVCMCLYWALQGLPDNLINSMPIWQVVCLPRTVYLVTMLSLIVILCKPLCLYVYKQPTKADLLMPSMGSVNPIPQLYNHLKLRWKESSKEQRSVPVVYGLATVYSSTIIVIVTLVALVIALLVGDGIAPSVTLQMAAMFLLLEVHATYITNQDIQGTTRNLVVPWCSVVMWGLVSSNFFFATGHQATITTIHWNAAYVGFHGDFESYALPAFLITLNTFAGLLLSTMGLPLLLFWPAVRDRVICAYSKCREHHVDGDTQQRGELELHERHQYLCASLFRLCLCYMLYFGIKLLGAMGAATLHQRHLMVWKIFAPHFVFEGVTWLFMSVFTLMSYLIVIRIDCVLHKWVSSIERAQESPRL